MKKISIIIAAWNSEKFINRAIDGIIAQSYKNLELIIVNDGSTDRTSEVIKKYQEALDKRGISFKYIEQENCGVATAFSRAIKECTGDYLYWQDSDDWLEEDGLRILAEYLEKCPDVDFVRGGVRMIEEGVNKKAIIRQGECIGEDNDMFRKYLFEKDSYCFTGIFMARMDDVRRKIPKFDIYETYAGQNWQLILPLTYKSKCATIDSIILNYLIRNDSHSHRIKTPKQKIERCKNHKKILKETIKRIPTMTKAERIYYYIMIDLKYLKKKTIIRIKRIIKRDK